MKKSLIVAATLAIAAIAWILSGQIRSDTEAEQALGTSPTVSDAPNENARMSVRVADLTAEPRPRRIIVSGRTDAFRRVQIRAETSGRVTKLMARRGDYVEANQELAQLALDDREAKLAEAEALRRQREIEYSAAEQLETKGFRSETELARAKAQLDAARAVVEQMRVDISHATIRAPFAGIVESGHVELGDYLGVGDAAFELVDLDPILVTGYATEREVLALAPGVVGRAQLLDGEEAEGIVSFVSSSADTDTRTYRFELEVPNPTLHIRAGLTSRIIVETQAEEAHLLSPSLLTLSDEGTVGVKLVDAEDRVVFQPVTILEDTAEGMWVSGLPRTTTVITVGQEFVIQGEKVTPVRGTLDGGIS